MKNIILVIVVIAILGAGAYYFFSRESELEMKQDETVQVAGEEFTFETPKKSAHYETNTPAHGSVLPAPPINIVIDFNFDLAPPSDISITKDGQEYGVGETVIDGNKLAMRRDFNQNAPDGLYLVEYNACWPDGSCHDGRFQFAIDSLQAGTYEDLRGQSSVTVHMSEIMFNPRNIRIDSGTAVTWVNDEEDVHYVNTDSHPAHTYHLDQNSRALELGDTYVVTFSEPGFYPYHCSAHEATMKGGIIVE